MTLHGLGWDRSNELPADFETFVAHQRGLESEQAARLIEEWMDSYQSAASHRPMPRESYVPSYVP